MVEMVNTSASTKEIGKNVKIGEGEPLELSEAKIITEGICAGSGKDSLKGSVEDSVEDSVWCSDSDSNCKL
jgi:hypothetical protein